MSFVIHQGCALAVLRTLPAESVHVCVTSPPYWGLRDYGIPPTAWDGDPNCLHLGFSAGEFCQCGAWIGNLGLEPTPELFVEHMVAVFREVRRVLHSSGTLWLNLGDSYVTGGGDHMPTTLPGPRVPVGWTNRAQPTGRPPVAGLKPKDLVMAPARVALALQADGWYLRSQIPWVKTNGMPESAADRPTSMVEYIFLFAKSEEYFYDREAVRVPASGTAHGRGHGVNPKAKMEGPNSRINRDRDPQHQTPAKIKAKQNRSFSAALAGGVVETRARRNSDWFFESFRGLVGDHDGDPLAMLVNPQPFSIEMCENCRTCFDQRIFRQLTKREDKQRICMCGATAWLSHFATFPEALVVPCIRAGTSEKGCCVDCGAPWERVIDRDHHGDWHPDPAHKHDRGAVNGTAKWAKTAKTQNARNGDPLHSISKADGRHVSFPAPVTTGWRSTCFHPLFPSEPVPCTVLDPFSGTARTGLASVKLGRRYIGIELNPDYIHMANWQAQERPKHEVEK